MKEQMTIPGFEVSELSSNDRLQIENSHLVKAISHPDGKEPIEITYRVCALEEHVLVEIYERKESRTRGGLILPGENEERPDSLARHATVLSVGTGILGGNVRHPIHVKPGDLVYIKRNRGVAIPLKGKEADRVVMAISCHDILVVMRDASDVEKPWSI